MAKVTKQAKKKTTSVKEDKKRKLFEAKRWARWKRERASPEYAAQSIALMRQLGKVTRESYLKLMLDMEEKYPGRGWREQMDELEKHFYDHGLSLKEIPKTANVVWPSAFQ